MTAADPLPEPLAVALDIARHFDSLGIQYLLAGSLASSLHGEPRATLDVDMVASLKPHQVSDLLRLLSPDYYVDPETAVQSVEAGLCFNAIHVPTAIKVDIFVAGSDAFEHERLRHRQQIALTPRGEPTLFVDTPEHTILRKLEWYRRGGEVSERQWRDAAAIARLHAATLDRARLRRWADVLGVTDLLDRLLA